MTEPINIASEIVRAGSTTYFIDARETKAGKPYLAITESRFRKDEEKHQRATISIFPEHISDFLRALNTVAGTIEQPK
jgi:hypothetical protein